MAWTLTKELVVVLYGRARGSQLNQAFSPWLWNWGTAPEVVREGPMHLLIGMGQYLTILTGSCVVMHTDRIWP